MQTISIICRIALSMILIIQSGYSCSDRGGIATTGTHDPAALCCACKGSIPNETALGETRVTLSCGHSFHYNCIKRDCSISGSCSKLDCGREIEDDTRRRYALVKFNESDPALKLIVLAELGNANAITELLETEAFADTLVLGEPVLAIALYKAAYKNHDRLVALLLNFSDKHRATVPLSMLAPTEALEVAIEDGRIETVKLLLARVDNSMLVDDILMRKYPALDYAICVAQYFGRHKIEALIRAKLAGRALEDVDLATIAEDTPLDKPAATAVMVEPVQEDVVMAVAPTEDFPSAAATDPDDDGVRLLSSNHPHRKKPSLRSKLTPKWFKVWRKQRREQAYNRLS